MKIAFGIETLKPTLTGIGYYTSHVVNELIKDKSIDSMGVLPNSFLSEEELKNIIYLFLNNNVIKPNKKSFIGELGNAARDSPALYNIVKKLRGGRCRKVLEALPKGTIYHEPNFVLYPYSGNKVITVHDLSHLRFPEFHPAARVAYLSKNLPRSTKNADIIFTVSQFTKEEMLSLGIVEDPRKIVVTPLGYDADFRPRGTSETNDVLARYGVQHLGYILAVATLEPRKNLERLLNAYSALPDYLKKEFPLVLVGAAGWSNKDLWRLVDKVRISNKVIITGYLPRADVQKLMSASALFAYPSLYEGFGLPVLEAMASGVSVLTSNNSSLNEVAGDAAYTVDPENVDEMTVGLEEMLISEAMRNEYRDRGIRRANLFSWKDCAEKTISAYKTLS
ncbi:MAG: glycosyltransferase family 4 protein [Pseudomonadota bacterium]